MVRSLLPEGDVFNNTRAWAKDPPVNVGVITIGCAKVGCEQLIFGGCCKDVVWCDDEPTAPQLAVVDSFGAAAYGVIEALCAALRERDPCTSDRTLHSWAERLGLLRACDPKWSDATLKVLLCLLPQLTTKIWNWRTVEELAAYMGADLTLRMAGDFSECGPAGWWTMARDRPPCPPLPITCPPYPPMPLNSFLKLVPECADVPESYNVIVCPADERRFPPNCTPVRTAPYDPELFQAFMWLLPSILPKSIYWCIYLCNPAECIV